MAEATEFHWPPLESDPAIFADFAKQLGIDEKYTVNEVFGFDEELLAFLPGPSLAAIACYRRLPDKKEEEKARGSMEVAHRYYMKQTGTLDNACGVIALIHSVLNNPQIELKEGSPLALFREANSATSPDDRASSLEGFKAIHNLYLEKAVEGNDDNKDGVHEHGGVKKTFHFVSFCRNAQNQLVEFDGTKQGPYLVAENVEEGQFMNAVAKEMMRRFQDGEIDDGAASMMAIGPAP